MDLAHDWIRLLCVDMDRKADILLSRTRPVYVQLYSNTSNSWRGCPALFLMHGICVALVSITYFYCPDPFNHSLLHSRLHPLKQRATGYYNYSVLM